MQAEESCTVALGQQKSTKAYWRRAKARKMMNRFEEAEQGELGLCPCQMKEDLLRVMLHFLTLQYHRQRHLHTLDHSRLHLLNYEPGRDLS